MIAWFITFVIFAGISSKFRFHSDTRFVLAQMLDDFKDNTVFDSVMTGTIWTLYMLVLFLISGIFIGLWFITVPLTIAALIIYKVRKNK